MPRTRPNHATVETPATKKARPAVEATAATNATELRLRTRQKRTENHAIAETSATKKARPAQADEATAAAKAEAAKAKAADAKAKADEEEAKQGEMAGNNDIPIEVFVTNHVPTLIFALAGAIVIPAVDRQGTEVALLRMINANLEHDSAPLNTLPGVLECLDFMKVPVEVTDKAGNVLLFPPTVPEGTVRYKLSHNGRSLRIGNELRTDIDRTWTILSAADEKAAAYITLATFGVRRFRDWNMPQRLLDVDDSPGAGSENRGSPPDSSNNHNDTPACEAYIQGPNSADSCVTCGLTVSDHGAIDEGAAQRLRNLLKGGSSQSLSPHINRADIRDRLSMGSGSPTGSISTMSPHTVMRQQSHKLLTWSKYGYDDWRQVREAAKLAHATGTCDHQKHHISDEMRQVLSAYCDRYTGAQKNEYGKAMRVLDDLPLIEWIQMVDSIMRLEFKIPVFDSLDLTLKKDAGNRPMLEEFRVNFILLSNQENFYSDKELRKILIDSIEKNFLDLSNSVLEPLYMDWRQRKPDLRTALFEVCEVLKPYTDKAVKLGGTSASPAKGAGKRKYCSICKSNDSHNTVDCTKGKAKEKCGHCEATDHKTADCPKKLFCSFCKRNGHNCRKKPDGKDSKDAKVPTAGYICKICNVPGHFVHNCPNKTKA